MGAAQGTEVWSPDPATDATTALYGSIPQWAMACKEAGFPPRRVGVATTGPDFGRRLDDSIPSEGALPARVPAVAVCRGSAPAFLCDPAVALNVTPMGVTRKPPVSADATPDAVVRCRCDKAIKKWTDPDPASRSPLPGKLRAILEEISGGVPSTSWLPLSSERHPKVEENWQNYTQTGFPPTH